MSLPLAFGWHHLLFANWAVPADVLAAHLPEALAVDEYRGVGICHPVRQRRHPSGPTAGAIGPPLPELNLRTYVTCDGEPGIYFFSLDAQGLCGVLGGRLTHHLPYYYARGRFRWIGDRAEFVSRRFHPGDRPARFEATYRPASEPFTPAPGSRAAFRTERRCLYTQATDGSIRYTDVEHDRWTLYPAEATVAENTLFEGEGFDAPEASPVLYYSPGIDVVTTGSRRWEESD